MDELTEGAKDIFIAGPTLAVVAMRQGLFRQRIEEGCRIRLLIPCPDPNSMAIQSLIPHWHTSREGFLSEIRSALVNFRILRESIPQVLSGSLQLRYVEWPLTLSFCMVDGEDPQRGSICVELLPYNTASPDRPHVLLLATDNDHWYSFFRERWEQLWNRGLPLDVDSVLCNWYSKI